MKDEEFKKNLETMLERFETIDHEIKKFLPKEKLEKTNQNYNRNHHQSNTPILDAKYNTRKIPTKNKYQ